MKTKIIKKFRSKIAYLIMSTFLLTAPFQSAHADDVRDIVFPVIEHSSFSDDFGAPRSCGRTHQGIDIFGDKMQPLIAVISGYLTHVTYPEPYYGYGVFLHGDDGYDYWYLHMNNDTPGTDDGLGGGSNAFATDIESGNQVTQGQLIGYIGDSGNAESTPPHLHFEIHRPDGNVINPYVTLQAAQRIAGPIFHPRFPMKYCPTVSFRAALQSHEEM